MKKIFVALFLVCSVGLTSCIPVAAFPAIAAIVSDATAVLSIIQQAVNAWFAHKQDAELQAEVNSAIQDSWSALRVATAATQGAEDISQADYDKAFLDFQKSYSNLQTILKKHGILNGTTLSMGPGQVGENIPEPLALTFKVKK